MSVLGKVCVGDLSVVLIYIFMVYVSTVCCNVHAVRVFVD